MRNLYTNAHPTTTTNPCGSDRQKTYEHKHHNLSDTAPRESIVHERAWKIKQPGAQYAASGGLQQRDTFCALSFFKGSIERLNVAIAGCFRSKVLNGIEIMLGLRMSE